MGKRVYLPSRSPAGPFSTARCSPLPQLFLLSLPPSFFWFLIISGDKLHTGLGPDFAVTTARLWTSSSITPSLGLFPLYSTEPRIDISVRVSSEPLPPPSPFLQPVPVQAFNPAYPFFSRSLRSRSRTITTPGSRPFFPRPTVVFFFLRLSSRHLAPRP